MRKLELAVVIAAVTAIIIMVTFSGPRARSQAPAQALAQAPLHGYWSADESSDELVFSIPTNGHLPYHTCGFLLKTQATPEQTAAGIKPTLPFTIDIVFPNRLELIGSHRYPTQQFAIWAVQDKCERLK